MQKFLYTIASVLILGSAVAQEKKEGADFDKKFRFGLRITPQPTWFSSNDNNNKPYGSKFGFGFGLNMEFRFSDIVALQTGIGGDLEGGNYTFKNDAKYQAMYFQDASNALIQPKNNQNITDLMNTSNVGYLLKERTIKTTFVTIPVILKMSTNEYSGFKYFGMFGGELGIRAKAVANDKYYATYKYNSTGAITEIGGEESQNNINISDDASLIPMRLGFNAGIGSEYRLGGSTSAFISVNYFRSLTNLLKKESDYIIYKYETDSGGLNTYSFVKQNIIMSAIRINVGILF
jgi:hypothetical protein